MKSYPLVSVHGGHSGQFCAHAVDSLEAVVARYVELGFDWFALTEHMASRTAFVPDDERAAGHDAASLARRFDGYFAEARRLAELHAGPLNVLVGFETEAYTGYRDDVAALVERHQPDYLVGSVHHVNDVPFDYSRDAYRHAVETSGGIVELYCDYFDLQLELIETLKPAVVGHFDLIRIFDPDYQERWREQTIAKRALRNLERIAELDLILDFNVRALAKGQPEPYVSAPWLAAARELGIAVVPGDDSHGVGTVGANVEGGIDLLIKAGFDLDWRRPALMAPS